MLVSIAPATAPAQKALRNHDESKQRQAAYRERDLGRCWNLARAREEVCERLGVRRGSASPSGALGGRHMRGRVDRVRGRPPARRFLVESTSLLSRC
jgi:hypothetical protein